MSINKPTISFLLASGISVPAGFPSTRQISEKLFSGEGIVMRNQHFYFGPSQPDPWYMDTLRHIKRIISLLQIVKRIVEGQYGRLPDTPATYEEIAHVISQCYNHIMGEYDNPIVEEFLKVIVDSLRPHFCIDPRDQADIDKRNERYAEEVVTRSKSESFFEEAENYIKDVVAEMLNVGNAPTGHLGFILDAINDPDYEQVNLITLNNDLLLEETIRKQGISYIDGFSERDEKKYFNPKTYRDNAHVCVIKPHGSINWYYDPETFQVVHSSPLEPTPYLRPYILIGTNNKLMEYARAPYTPLFSEFYLRLQRSDVLIVCGYGFGDKGVNSQIIDWMYDDKSHRIVVIHGGGEAIIDRNMSGAIKRNFQIWIKERRVAFVEKFLSLENPLSWREVKAGI